MANLSLDKRFRQLFILMLGALAGAVVASCNSKDGSRPAAPPAQSSSSTASSASTGAKPSDPFSAGAEAPDFALVDLDGKPKSLKDFRGKWVLLNFWATWCTPCIAEMAALERLSKVLADKGFIVVGINMDDGEHEEQVREFLKERGLTFQILRDPENRTQDIFKISGFPETFLIAPDGKFVGIFDSAGPKREVVRVLGDRPWDSPAYTKAVTERISGTR